MPHLVFNFILSTVIFFAGTSLIDAWLKFIKKLLRWRNEKNVFFTSVGSTATNTAYVNTDQKFFMYAAGNKHSKVAW